jgi:hypothetical protein
MVGNFRIWSIVAGTLCVLMLTCGDCTAQTAAQKGAQPAPQAAPKATPQPAAKTTVQPTAQVISEPTSEDMKNQSVQIGLLVQFLNKYGYNSYSTKSGDEEQIITFMVKDRKTSQAINYAMVYLPKTQLLRIEAFDLADVPSDKNKLNSIYQKMAELNSKRTVGKFCLDLAKKKLHYVYYRTVFGGICYADFKATLGIIEFILLNDLKQIKEAGS